MRQVKSILMICMLVVCTSSIRGQQYITDLGLPPELGYLENYQIRTKTTHSFLGVETVSFVSGKFTRTYTYEQATKTELFGAYPLNLVYNYQNEFNFDYMGEQSSGGYLYYHPKVPFTVQAGPDAGKTYPGYEASLLVTDSALVWKGTTYPTGDPNTTYITVKIKSINNTKPGVTYKPVFYDKKYLLKDFYRIFNVTEQIMAELSKQKFNLQQVNKNTHVTSIFGLITNNGNTYQNATVINGLPWRSQLSKQMTTPFGTTLSVLKFSWVLYNECAATDPRPADAIGWDVYTHGNFGECFRFMYDMSDPRCESISITPGNGYISLPDHSLTYNQNEPCKLQLIVHRTPAPEKNSEQEGYWNISEGHRAYTLHN